MALSPSILTVTSRSQSMGSGFAPTLILFTCLLVLRSTRASNDDGYYSDNTMWSEYSILPHRCLKLDGQEVVAFEMFGNGNDQCAKKNLGLYTVPLTEFLTEYSSQALSDAEMFGYEEPDEEYLNYLSCYGFETDDGDYVSIPEEY